MKAEALNTARADQNALEATRHQLSIRQEGLKAERASLVGGQDPAKLAQLRNESAALAVELEDLAEAIAAKQREVVLLEAEVAEEQKVEQAKALQASDDVELAAIAAMVQSVDSLAPFVRAANEAHGDSSAIRRQLGLSPLPNRTEAALLLAFRERGVVSAAALAVDDFTLRRLSPQAEDRSARLLAEQQEREAEAARHAEAPATIERELRRAQAKVEEWTGNYDRARNRATLDRLNEHKANLASLSARFAEAEERATACRRPTIRRAS